jgi:hypothetical protein
MKNISITYTENKGAPILFSIIIKYKIPYTGSEFTVEPKRNNNYEWTWKYLILPTSNKNHRQSVVSMQTKRTNSRPFNISVRNVKVRKKNTEEQCTEGRQLANQ